MGADVPEQAIKAGLVDEIQIHLIVVLLGRGKRPFDDLGTERIATWNVLGSWSHQKA